jgi:hypothetical protein
MCCVYLEDAMTPRKWALSIAGGLLLCIGAITGNPTLVMTGVNTVTSAVQSAE